jgi:nucleotide-binding universal stress UspA family protein
MANSDEGEASVVIASYDGSPAARQAIVAAAKILGSCRMLVVTVWEEGLAYQRAPISPDGTTIAPTVEPGVALELDHAFHQQAEGISQEGVALARSVGLNAQALALPDEGNVARTILRLAGDCQASAIVVGSRGLGGIRARLEGSTSKSLLKHARCPVIVVHETDKAHDEGKASD